MAANTEDPEQEPLSDSALDSVAGGSGDDEAEDSIVVDYGAIKIEYSDKKRRSTPDDVIVDGRIITGE